MKITEEQQAVLRAAILDIIRTNTQGEQFCLMNKGAVFLREDGSIRRTGCLSVRITIEDNIEYAAPWQCAGKANTTTREVVIDTRR